VKSIGDYRYLTEGVTVAEYLSEDPPAVLMHHAAMESLGLVGGSPGDTRNRLALGDDPVRRVPGTVLRSEAYTVLPIVARGGGQDTRMTIGCGSSCDIFLDDATLSREHAWFERREADYFIFDHNSTTGTRVNGVILMPATECELAPGDAITLGAVELTFLGPLEFYNFVKIFLKKRG